MKRCILIGIRLYQKFISPFLGPRCRFYPSCSEYAYQAIECYGGIKGSIIAIKRLSKCHPFHPGGVDELHRIGE